MMLPAAAPRLVGGLGCGQKRLTEISCDDPWNHVEFIIAYTWVYINAYIRGQLGRTRPNG